MNRPVWAYRDDRERLWLEGGATAGTCPHHVEGDPACAYTRSHGTLYLEDPRDPAALPVWQFEAAERHWNVVPEPPAGEPVRRGWIVPRGTP